MDESIVALLLFNKNKFLTMRCHFIKWLEIIVDRGDNSRRDTKINGFGLNFLTRQPVYHTSRVPVDIWLLDLLTRLLYESCSL